jgi:hypothetical protein
MTKDDKSSNSPDSQSVDAVRHVGPTLESEEDRVYVPKTDQLSPEEQVASEPDLNIETVADSGGGKPELRKGAEPEPLKTRLPGDTSSDPHTDIETDLGRDKPRNAA